MAIFNSSSGGSGVTQEELTTALADKQDTLVNGTGTTVLNNGVNINTPVQQIVTQAEFDALPEDDQNKGLWVISDGESGGGSSSSSGGEIYSTEETRIGTWIDGKPLYRMVVETSTLGLNVAGGMYSFPKEFTIVDVHGAVISLNTGGVYGDIYMIPGPELPLYITTYDGGVQITQPQSNNSKVCGKPCRLIIEYTKTTDTATQEVTT